jgi:uncharacterized membrane protein YphA (DoxX/SURF4 family)
MHSGSTELSRFGSLFLRLALGASFLSAVADRFGLWGVYGQPNVSWGNYGRFLVYTAKLNWFLPAGIIPTLAVLATAAETILGLLLVLGWKTRTVALLSGILLTIFSVSMTMALGVKAPLNLSVFSAAGGALLLATCTEFSLQFGQPAPIALNCGGRVAVRNPIPARSFLVLAMPACCLIPR